MVKPLTAKHRKTIVTDLVERVPPSCRALMKQLEPVAYTELFEIDSFSAYLGRLVNIAYNMCHNPDHLVAEYSSKPLQLLTATDEELARGYKRRTNKVKGAPAAKDAKETAEDATQPLAYAPMVYVKPVLADSKHQSAHETAYLFQELEKKIPSALGLGNKELKAIIVCNKCGPKAKVWHQAKQLNSGDEAQSVLCYCSGCQRRWVQRK